MPMSFSGQITWVPYAVERDVRGSQGLGFNPSLGPIRRIRLLQNYYQQHCAQRNALVFKLLRG